jgi:hypothetical protein
MSDIYLQITETPTVVTLSAPVVASVMVNTVTVANVVSVNVVTMPAITVQAAAPSVTTVAGTVTIGSCVTHGVNVANSVTISSLPAISGTVTANTRNNGISNDPWVYIPRLTMSHPDVGSIILDGYYRFDGVNAWGPPPINDNYAYLVRTDDRSNNDQWLYKLYFHNEFNDQEIELANITSTSPDFPTSMNASGGTLVSGSLTFNTEQRESYAVRVTNSVTIGNSVTVSALPVSLSTTTIGGTARLNVTLSSATTIGATAPSYGNLYGGSDGTNLRAISVDTSGRTVVTGSVSVANTVPVSGTFWQATQPVSGTVTANVSGTVPVSGTFWQATQPVSGTVTANISGTVPVSISSVTIGNTVTVAGTVTANVASTTVTVSALPSGALTTRFGSVVTANTAGITTAVTNTSRKYLLAQNISTGTVTIGIGFSPTTTQGIQLTAGAGLTFDSFVPTGAVYWLGATTGAAYTILEG